MGSNFNFKSFEHEPRGNFPLARQSSVYSLTFDEFQSTVGGNGKEYGSMNMDELLKSIWSAEENQNIGSTSVVGLGNGSSVQEGGGYLQKQGSLTLPQTISQKTVDEVWKDMSSKDRDSSLLAPVGFGVPLREPTLGEVTLEEFLVRAGVVREEPQSDNVGFLGDFLRPVTDSGLGFEFQPQQNNNNNQINLQSANLPLSVNGVRSSVNQLGTQQPIRQQQILPKQPALGYGAPMGVSNNQMGSPRIKGGMVGLSDGAISNMVGLGANGVTLASDGLTKSNGDTSSVSPVPYVFNGGSRGRKGAVLEKVVERRQRRMIKNRESAARSRARKQAYTTELEAEVAKLKEENDELRRKQEEIMEMQKNQQVLEIMNQRNGAKRRCLRRTQTGIW